MTTDEKNCNNTEDGEAPQKKEYMVLLELDFQPTNMHDTKHSLGIFTTVKRSYCTGCVAGQGSCRHRSEQLWFQYYHWTNERLDINRPPNLDACSWAPGSISLHSSVKCHIYQQQTMKHKKTIEAQKAKIKRGAQRNCTEGISGEYQIYINAAKQRHRTGRFTAVRCNQFFKLLREQQKEDVDELGEDSEGDDDDYE